MKLASAAEANIFKYQRIARSGISRLTICFIDFGSLVKAFRQYVLTGRCSRVGVDRIIPRMECYVPNQQSWTNLLNNLFFTTTFTIYQSPTLCLGWRVYMLRFYLISLDSKSTRKHTATTTATRRLCVPSTATRLNFDLDIGRAAEIVYVAHDTATVNFVVEHVAATAIMSNFVRGPRQDSPSTYLLRWICGVPRTSLVVYEGTAKTSRMKFLPSHIRNGGCGNTSRMVRQLIHKCSCINGRSRTSRNRLH